LINKQFLNNLQFKPGIRPFRVPANIGKFPILPLFGFGTTVYMALQFEVEVVLVGLAIIAIGAILYIILRRRKDFMNSD